MISHGLFVSVSDNDKLSQLVHLFLYVCHLDKDKGPRRLMKKGLTLILVGHINFILGAIVHGNVLRHISKPNQHITTEYTVANIISVTSGLLVSQSLRHSYFVSMSNLHQEAYGL